MIIPNISNTTVSSLMNKSEDLDNTEKQSSSVIYSAIIIIPMILLAVIGNALTICCFLRDKRLHKTSNIYILNLSICDFLIGSVIMPIYFTYTLNDEVWIYGNPFCKVFTVFDSVTSGVTVIVMVLISYDHLYLLKHWTTYHKFQTVKRAYIKCFIAWIYLFVLNCPATVGWNLWTGNNVTKQNDCVAEYSYNGIYVSVMAVVQFVCPLMALIVIHIMIVIEIRKLYVTREELTMSNSLNGSEELSLQSNSWEHKNLSKSPTLVLRNNHHALNGRKAVKSLVILTSVFIIMWAPFAIQLVVRSFCPTCEDELAYESATWILWFKSGINPFLYAYNSNKFRENFSYFLFCRRTIKTRKSRLSYRKYKACQNGHSEQLSNRDTEKNTDRIHSV